MATLFTLAMAMVAASCGSDLKETPPDGEVTLNFRVSNYEQVDIDGTPTRSTELTNLKYLTLGVYDAETLALVGDTVTQCRTDSGYGNFTVTLPYGDYKLLFLGYPNDHFPDMTDLEAITFTGNYVPHLFSNVVDLTVDDETVASQSVVLQRVVAYFSVEFSDYASAQSLDHVDIGIKGASYELNALTGHANRLLERNYTLDVQSDFNGCGVFMFLMEDEGTVDCTMNIYNTGGELVAGHTFTGVPVKLNQHTIYRGNFYNTENVDEGFSVSLGDDYDNWTILEERSFGYSEY
ncbi:MAG: FimB/Mfa2 family fimbrial subunit [Prevotellaceae bacterium]|nr:FimB/Mfa2 family fimbrial subunit [Prevotellaceae bacterium]